MEDARLLQDLQQYLRVDASFDLVRCDVNVAGGRATIIFVDGLTKDETLSKMLQHFAKIPPEDVAGYTDAVAFAARFVPYIEVECSADIPYVARQVLSGATALVVPALDQVIIIDCRTYPVRGVQEPESDRVMRGSRDGLVETMLFNVAMIRRRLRDPSLTFEAMQVGDRSATDICLCYMDDRVDKKYLDRLRKHIQQIPVSTLSMGQESFAECLLPRQWYNPFPRVRYTERPDSAAASIAEGQIIVLVDNSPAAMILPTSIFSFSQDTNDFYFPPIVGTYLRLVRSVVFIATLFLTPVWYWLMENPDKIPPALEFIRLEEMGNIPLIVQTILVEIMIDVLKLAALNTPSSLGNALSLVGALIFGEFAVQAGIFAPELLAYMAFVAIASFTQPSRELTYSFKLFRILLIVLIWLFGGWGLIGGMLTMLIVLVTTKTVAGGHYLYPLIPFNGKAMLRLTFRQFISKDNAG